MTDSKNLAPHGYPELVRKPSARVSDAPANQGSEPAPLVDLLQDIDGIKHEIQERMRRIEAVKHAKSVLQEDEVKSEALNKKLAAIGQAMHDVDSGSGSIGKRAESSSLLRLQAREVLEQAGISNREAEFQHRSVEPTRLSFKEMSAGLSSGLPAPEPPKTAQPAVVPASIDETATVKVDSVSQPATFISSSEELSRAEEMWRQAEVALAEARRVFEESSSVLNEAAVKSEKVASDLLSTQQELTTAYQFAAVAAQRQHTASEMFYKTHLWTVLSAAFAWVALAWTSWFVVRSAVAIWAPAVASIVILVAGVIISRTGKRKE
jgi:hypothetical protein